MHAICNHGRAKSQDQFLSGITIKGCVYSRGRILEKAADRGVVPSASENAHRTPKLWRSVRRQTSQIGGCTRAALRSRQTRGPPSSGRHGVGCTGPFDTPSGNALGRVDRGSWRICTDTRGTRLSRGRFGIWRRFDGPDRRRTRFAWSINRHGGSLPLVSVLMGARLHTIERPTLVDCLQHALKPFCGARDFSTFDEARKAPSDHGRKSSS